MPRKVAGRKKKTVTGGETTRSFRQRAVNPVRVKWDSATHRIYQSMRSFQKDVVRDSSRAMLDMEKTMESAPDHVKSFLRSWMQSSVSRLTQAESSIPRMYEFELPRKLTVHIEKSGTWSLGPSRSALQSCRFSSRTSDGWAATSHPPESLLKADTVFKLITFEDDLDVCYDVESLYNQVRSQMPSELRGEIDSASILGFMKQGRGFVFPDSGKAMKDAEVRHLRVWYTAWSQFEECVSGPGMGSSKCGPLSTITPEQVMQVGEFLYPYDSSLLSKRGPGRRAIPLTLRQALLWPLEFMQKYKGWALILLVVRAVVCLMLGMVLVYNSQKKSMRRGDRDRARSLSEADAAAEEELASAEAAAAAKTVAYAAFTSIAGKFVDDILHLRERVAYSQRPMYNEKVPIYSLDELVRKIPQTESLEAKGLPANEVTMSQLSYKLHVFHLVAFGKIEDNGFEFMVTFNKDSEFSEFKEKTLPSNCKLFLYAPYPTLEYFNIEHPSADNDWETKNYEVTQLDWANMKYIQSCTISKYADSTVDYVTLEVRRENDKEKLNGTLEPLDFYVRSYVELKTMNEWPDVRNIRNAYSDQEFAFLDPFNGPWKFKEGWELNLFVGWTDTLSIIAGFSVGAVAMYFGSGIKLGLSAAMMAMHWKDVLKRLSTDNLVTALIKVPQDIMLSLLSRIAPSASKTTRQLMNALGDGSTQGAVDLFTVNAIARVFGWSPLSSASASMAIPIAAAFDYSRLLEDRRKNKYMHNKSPETKDWLAMRHPDIGSLLAVTFSSEAISEVLSVFGVKPVHGKSVAALMRLPFVTKWAYNMIGDMLMDLQNVKGMWNGGSTQLITSKGFHRSACMETLTRVALVEVEYQEMKRLHKILKGPAGTLNMYSTHFKLFDDRSIQEISKKILVKNAIKEWIQQVYRQPFEDSNMLRQLEQEVPSGTSVISQRLREDIEKLGTM